MPPDDVEANYATFRDCLSSLVLQSLAVPINKPSRKRKVRGRKNEIKPVGQKEGEDGGGGQDAEELSDFIEVGWISLRAQGSCKGTIADEARSISPLTSSSPFPRIFAPSPTPPFGMTLR